jgi:hypothetical protein
MHVTLGVSQIEGTTQAQGVQAQGVVEVRSDRRLKGSVVICAAHRILFD